MEKLQLKIDGMHRGSCVGHVTRALSDLPGVKVETVQVGSATLSAEKGRTGDILQAVTEAGYTAKLVTDAAPAPKPSCSCCHH